MSKSERIIIGSIVGLLVLIGVTLLFADRIIENKIKKTIANQVPKEFQLNDYDISVSTYSGSVRIENLQASVKDTTAVFKDSQFSLTKASVSGLRYWKYFFSNKITVDEVTLYNLHFKTYRDSTKTDESPEKKQNNFKEHIKAGKFTLVNASFLFENADESIALQVDSLNFSIRNVAVNQNTIQQKIPVQYSDMELNSNTIQYQLNDYDLLSFSSMSLKNQELQIKDLTIKTIYSKTELSEVILKERDHIDAEMNLVTLRDFHFDVSDPSFQISASDFMIESPVLTVYRDKLVRDDTSIKSLYSKSIRNIPFALTIDSIHIKNATIVYEEKLSAIHQAVALNFSNLNAAIGNFSNTYAQGEKKTTIQLNTIFMNESPLKIDWNFDVNDPDDTFQIQGELDALNTTKMNAFTKSSFNVSLEGKVNKTYFNIHGNDHHSSIDLSISYDNFKLEILNEGNKSNWLLTAVANIFVKKKSDTREGAFENGKAKIKRNRDKSFFNFLWINIKEGLKDVMVTI